MFVSSSRKTYGYLLREIDEQAHDELPISYLA
jgi:hypothetical protein